MLDFVPQVLQEVVAGDGLTMGQVAKLVPSHRGTGHADASCIWRWVTIGTKTPDGKLVKLEAGRLGGRWLTSRAALARFMAALTPSDNSTSAPIAEPSRTPSARRRANESATAKLIAAGA